MNPITATIKIEGMPEMVTFLRKEMADIVRNYADKETPVVALRLRQVADVFEGRDQ